MRKRDHSVALKVEAADADDRSDGDQVNVGILILRLALAVILVAHSSQKTFGWFQGQGLTKMAAWFHNLGLHPGRVMVIIAASAEAAAAISLGTGFLTPLGALAAAAGMLVAGLTMHVDAGKLWNAAGGGEYPYVLSAVAVALAFMGPGTLSLDHLIADAAPGFNRFDSGAVVGIVVAVLAILCAVPFLVTIRRNRRSAAADSNAG